MWYDMTWYNMILIGGWVVTLFFCMWLLRNYKVLKVDTWRAGAVQYKDDAYVFLYWVFSTYQFISFWYNMSFLMYAFMLQGNQWRRDALASHCTLQWEWDSWRWEAHSAAREALLLSSDHRMTSHLACFNVFSFRESWIHFPSCWVIQYRTAHFIYSSW